MFLIVSAILCSCAIVPKPQIGLEEFVHNLSRDMDCLQYCAERAKGKQGTDFVLKNPLDITLNVTDEGKISAASNPTIFSMLGLEFAGSEKRAGSISLRLHIIEHCSTVVIFPKKDQMGKKVGKPLQFFNAAIFHDIINGTEYLYVRDNTKKNSILSDINLTRFDLNKINHIFCQRLYSICSPECKCP